MKTIIRKGVFETNSSSTHTLVIMNDDEYTTWKDGTKYRVDSCYGLTKGLENGSFHTKEELLEYAKKIDQDRIKYLFEYYDKNDIEDITAEQVVKYLLEYEDITSYESFCDTDYLEVDEETYTTKSGEVIHIVAKYGYDG